jgi:hypothetical protein
MGGAAGGGADAGEDGEPAAESSGPVGGEVEGHPAYPGFGGVVGAQSGPACGCSGEGFLDEVFGFGQVAGDEPELADEPEEHRLVEGFEFLLVGHRGSLGPCGGWSYSPRCP